VTQFRLFSLRNLWEFCSSAVKSFQETVTAETPRTPSGRRAFKLGHYGILVEEVGWLSRL